MVLKRPDMTKTPWTWALSLTAVVACGPAPTHSGAGSTVGGSSASNLEARCEDEPEDIPEDALRCGADRTFECGVDPIGDLYVTAGDLGRVNCGTSTLTVSDAGPFEVGIHPIDVVETSTSGSVDVCTSTVTVVDTTVPQVSEKRVDLWPPNHRMVEIAPEDCATVFDACAEDDVDFAFTYVIVDEAENGRGDGNFAPDVVLCDDDLKVRAERAGPEDGRVYRIGFEVGDGNGNRVSGECTAEVPHDRSRDPVEGPEAYRVDAGEDACNAGDDPPGDDDDDCACDDDDDECRDRVGRHPHGDTVNTGPLPEGCVKLEGDEIGRTGASYTFGDDSVVIDAWTPKRDDGSDYVGFEYTLTSTPAFVSVKAGRDVFTDWATETATQSWSNPNGDSGPKAKGISNVVFCPKNPFMKDDDCAGGEDDDPRGHDEECACDDDEDDGDDDEDEEDDIPRDGL